MRLVNFKHRIMCYIHCLKYPVANEITRLLLFKAAVALPTLSETKLDPFHITQEVLSDAHTLGLCK